MPFVHDLKYVAKKYASIKEDLRLLSEQLKLSPLEGQSLGKDCYKIRMAISSKEMENREVAG